ncbi:MAG: cytochrome b [Solirubrobacterales bacterium]
MPERYDSVAKSLHWLMALLIIGLIAVGAVMEDLPKGDFRNQVFGIHKAIGVIALALVVLRLGWRGTRGAPALPADMPAREQLFAKLGHMALYLLMVLAPIAGILMSQSGGRPVVVLGWTLPVLIGKDEALHEVFEGLHGLTTWGLAALVALHAAAAFRHHFMLKDDILRRMLPGRG